MPGDNEPAPLRDHDGISPPLMTKDPGQQLDLP